ncbi:MAG: GNAT family N-acetyltransferase [Verrucomicrobiota bacterium]
MAERSDAGLAFRVVEFGSGSYEDAWQLREELLRKPLGMRFTLETREADREKMHCVAEADDHVVAVVLVGTNEDGTAQAGSVAVQEDWQGKGVGLTLMKFAEQVAADKGAYRMTLDARVNVLGFYRKLGYRECGPEFEKVGIPHRRMEKLLG